MEMEVNNNNRNREHVVKFTLCSQIKIFFSILQLSCTTKQECVRLRSTTLMYTSRVIRRSQTSDVNKDLSAMDQDKDND